MGLPSGWPRFRSWPGRSWPLLVLGLALGMVDAMIDLIPRPKSGHIGLFRDPETHEPVKYYCKMPNDIAERQVFIVDPMSGHRRQLWLLLPLSRNMAVSPSPLMNIIVAPRGIKVVREAHPDVDIF